ncbi:MAG: hypothetical protein QOJ50_4017 [Cryptosporangiaceae bacterium]|jgi:hypothetical protein|nr:hypothetical protein [Cryptosporangiaceae bacterium]
MSRRILAAAALAAVAVPAAILGTGAAAQASQFVGTTLRPGEQRCVQQYASYQVRAEGHASLGGAKFKLQFNGVTLPGTGSPGLVNDWAAEARRAYGTFPGPGYYVACVTNNGTANTNIQLQLRTDAEFA